MTKSPSRPLRYRSLLAALVTFLAVFLPAGTAQAGGHEVPKLTVMTRNLYLGTGLFNTNIQAAPTYQALVDAVTLDWQHVLATNFRVRARALAAEVDRARPDVLGLQEVTLWRDQFPSDILANTQAGLVQIGPNTPNAQHVVFDFLAILRTALAQRGLDFVPVVTSRNADAEAPRQGAHGLVDLRITDRDVILVRRSLLTRFSNPLHANYATFLPFPTIIGVVPFLRGWTSIDYRYGINKKVRVFNTHLEVDSPTPADLVQAAQGGEAVIITQSSPYPVIAVGDYNSPADGSTTVTYSLLVGSGLVDAWAVAHPSDPGLTCCQDELLDNPVGQETVRIDLILSNGGFPVDRVFRTGTQPFRQSPPPLWGSDHFGLTARYTLVEV
jgi:endonuclease/exonuclease/phosphatase family metal-dependent hydrolase